MSNDKEHIDDLFKNHFDAFEPEAPKNVWNKIKNDLGNDKDSLYSKFDSYEPEAPAWVWMSLKHILYKRQKIKLAKRVSAAAVFIVTFFGIIASQFLANKTINQLFSFEKKIKANQNIVQINPINPFENSNELMAQKPNNLLHSPTDFLNIPNSAGLPFSSNNESLQSDNNFNDQLNNIIATQDANQLIDILSLKLMNPHQIFNDNIQNPEKSLSMKLPKFKRKVPQPIKKPIIFEVSANIGNSYTTPHLNPNNDPKVNAIRQSSENGAWSSNYGINLNMIKNHWVFTTGLSFNEYNFNGNYTFQDEDVVNLHPILPDDKKGTYVQEDYLLNVPTTKNATVLSNFKFVGLVNQFGYILHAGKHWSIIPKVGINLGYLVDNNGPKLVPGSPSELKTMDPVNMIATQNRIMTNGQLLFQVNYRVSKTIQIGVEPFATYQLNKVSVSTPLGSQLLNTKGFNVSLSYQF